jgi:DNA-binding IclR family transcriptional regulator
MDKSTTHRLLQRLSEERMLVRNSGQRGYRLGPLLHELGLSALPEHNLKEIARPELSQLAKLTGDMTFLVGRSGFETVCLDRIAGNFHIQTMTSGVGDRRPLGIGAGGQAILARLSDAEIQQVLVTIGPQLRRYRLFTPQSLMADVARCRKLGYSLDESMAAPDVNAMGMAIRQTSGAPIGSVFIATTSNRLGSARQSEVARHLASCVATIEAELTRG